MRVDLDLGIQCTQPLRRHIQLRLTDIRRRIHDLPLQVGHVDRIEIDQANVPDSGRREVQRRRRTESARTDDQHVALLQLLLPGIPEIGK
jgi:hypothetical protein